MANVRIRQACPDDLAPLVAIADAWWDGPPVSHLLHRFYFEHFADTCFVAHDAAGGLAGFLVGFLSQTRPDEAYIRLVAVHPEQRGAGVGRALYKRFFAVARERGRDLVRSVTSPGNRASVAFHTRLGFLMEPGDAAADDGLPMLHDYDGRGGARVRFVKHLAE